MNKDNETNGVTKTVYPTANVYSGENNVSVLSYPEGDRIFPVRFFASKADQENEVWAASFSRYFQQKKNAEAAAINWAKFDRAVLASDNGGATADRYTVIIGSSVYLMSRDAHMPNGVCMYHAETEDAEQEIEYIGDPQIALGDLPRGVVFAIVFLVAEHLSIVKEFDHVQ